MTRRKKILLGVIIGVLLFSSYLIPDGATVQIKIILPEEVPQEAVVIQELSTFPIGLPKPAPEPIVEAPPKEMVLSTIKSVEEPKAEPVEYVHKEGDLSDYEIAMLCLKRHESLRYEAYWDVSQWTVGWGTRSRKGEIVDLKEANIRTKAEFERVYGNINKRYPKATRWQKLVLTVTDYNVGKFGPGLDKAIKSGNSQRIARYLKRYNKNSKGVYMEGLDKRRKEEAKLLLSEGAARQALGRKYKEGVKRSINKANAR